MLPGKRFPISLLPLLAGIVMATPLKSATIQMQDPVVLENEFLRVTVDRAKGGVIRSLVFKPLQRELVEEYHTGETIAGGLAEDRFPGQKYPGELATAPYLGKVKTEAGGQILVLHRKLTSGINEGLEFVKTYHLRADESRVEVDWEIINRRAKNAVVSPWVHNIVDRRLTKTILPQTDAIRVIQPSPDYFVDPVRNWMSAWQKEGLLVSFVTGYDHLIRQYFCYWNGFHSLEWAYTPTELKPDETWHSKYFITIAANLKNPCAYASPELSVGYAWEDDRLKLEVAAYAGLGEVILTPEIVSGAQRRKLTPIPLRLQTSQTVETELALKGLPSPEVSLLRIGITRDGKDLRLGDALNLPEREIVLDLVPGRNLTEIRPHPWPALKNVFAIRKPQTWNARRLVRAGSLAVWHCDPLEKVFAEDEIVEAGGQDAIELVLPRGGLGNVQLVLRNDAEKPLELSCAVEGFPEDGSVLSGSNPVGIYRVAYIPTKIPSRFSAVYPLASYPDPLLSQESFQLEPHKNQPLWLSLRTAPMARPGVHQGTVVLTCGGNKLRVPINLNILPVTLPDRPFLRTTIGCWSVASNVLQTVECPLQPAEFQKQCWNLFADARLTPRETSIEWSASEQNLRNSIQEWMKRPFTTLSIPKNIYNDDRRLKQVADFLETNNLIAQAFIYAYDEAPASRFGEVKTFCDRLHAIHPRLKFLGTIGAKDPSQLFGSVNIWCRAVADLPWIRERQRAGDEFFSGNIEPMEIEGSTLELRKAFWHMKAAGYTGFLYWNVIAGYGRDNPWTDPSCANINGNAHLLYPTREGPAPSIRWKIMAEGVDDFDLLTLLDHGCKRENTPSGVHAEALRFLDGLNETLDTVKTPADFHRLRHQLVQLLQRMP